MRPLSKFALTILSLGFILPLLPIERQNQGPALTGSVSSSSSVAPVFVSSVQGASTEWGESATATDSVTTYASGTETCGNYTYCIQLPDPVLSGNSVAVGYSYYQTTAEKPTITDDQSNSYTCITESLNSTYDRYMGACYAFDLTNGPRDIKIVFPDGVGYGQAEAVEWKGGSSLRTSASGTGSSTETLSTSALSSAATDDFIVQFVQIANPSNTYNSNNSMGTIGFGSGWNGFAADWRDGISGQIYIPSSSGSVTPSETDSIDVSYTSVALDFETSNQGTAPTGMYISCEWMSNSEEPATPATLTPQLPCPTGNTLHISLNGGQGTGSKQVSISSITDSNASWINGGPTVNGDNSGGCANYDMVAYACEWYAMDWTPTNAEAPTINIDWNGNSGTGNDASIWADAIAGASSISAVPYGAIAYSDPDISGTGSSYTLTSSYYPQMSSGLSFVSMGQEENTGTGQSGSSTLFDLQTNGGENLSGPWINDENNWRGHVYNTATGDQTYIESETSSTTALAGVQSILSSVASSTAQWPISPSVSCQGTANGLTCSITPKGTATSLIALIGSYVADGGQTVTSLCNNGTTCGSGHAFTCNAASNNGTNGNVGGICYWFDDGLSGSQTFTLEWSKAVSNSEIAIYEVANISAIASVSSGSNPAETNSGSVSCPSVTPSVSPTFIASAVVTSDTITASPASGSSFLAGSGIWSDTTDAWSSEENSVETAQTPTYTGTGTTGCSVEAFK